MNYGHASIQPTICLAFGQRIFRTGIDTGPDDISFRIKIYVVVVVEQQRDRICQRKQWVKGALGGRSRSDRISFRKRITGSVKKLELLVPVNFFFISLQVFNSICALTILLDDAATKLLILDWMGVSPETFSTINYFAIRCRYLTDNTLLLFWFFSFIFPQRISTGLRS